MIMKKIFLVAIIPLIIVSKINAQESYYWYQHSKQKLITNTQKKYITTDSYADAVKVAKDLIAKGISGGEFQRLPIGNWFEGDDSLYWAYINLQKGQEYDHPLLSYSSPTYYLQDGTPVGISNFFYVKLRDKSDTLYLYRMAKDCNVVVVGEIEFMPMWYVLKCSKVSKRGTCEMADEFYQSGVFEYSAPDIMMNHMITCANDPYYSNQWNLHNEGQNGGVSGIDINYCAAKQITEGDTNIVVAVIDHGVQFDHPDIHHVYRKHYDTYYVSSESDMIYGEHGTNCAGIIGAWTDNETGIAGIAHVCQIMSISHRLIAEPLSDLLFASGFHFALNNSASVISNSWRSAPSDILTESIMRTLTEGRNGKGCIVVFATGNSNEENVLYPACLDGVISVGAMSRCGERKSPVSCDNKPTWGSNYGEELDLMAPGDSVFTTTIDGGYKYFSGTSAACPHVSGVVSLMLSVNPNLTGDEVYSILCNTAQKVGVYDYRRCSNHVHGSWHKEVGYGLVDAGAAVQRALELKFLSNLHVRDNMSDQGYEPNISTTDYADSPDIWITTTSGAAVRRIEEGGQYLVNVRVNNNDTIASSSNIRVKLNWTRVGSNMNWGRAWNGGISNLCDQIRGGYVGEQTLSAPIVAGGDGIVSIPWTVPARPTGLPHCSVLRYLNGLSYALLARVEDGHETIGEDMNDYNICDFVLQNNNVAMKTYNILQENIRDNVVAVDMSRDRGDGIVRVAYSSTSNGSGTHISDVANVYLQFDSSMLAAWPQATRQMTGCRQVNDSVFVITDTTATFDGFLLDTAETYFISSYVRYRIPQADSTEHRFSLNFSIVDGDSVFADGDIDYTVMYDEAVYFNVTAYEDMTVMAGETFELSAEADAADATFEWYNMQDVLIGTGDHISLSTTTTQQYYVRGYSPSDNTVGYDTVMITVKHGIITKITPNPAKNQVLVKYTLADDVTNPTISLRNSYGMVVYSASVGTHPAQCHINIKTIDVVPLPTGNYTVSLEDNGVVLDSKTLVVQ